MTGTSIAKMAFRGLVTNPNELAITGDGAFRRFTNGVLSRPALAQKRRGIKYLAQDEDRAINKFFNYDGSLLCHAGSGSTGRLMTVGTASLTAITGQINPVSGRLRCCIAGKNFYVAGTVPSRLSGVTSTPVAAGGLFSPGLDPLATALPVGTVLPAGYAVAYRTVFGLTDAKGYLHLGEVSARHVVVNTSTATANPKVRAIIPSTATTSHFIQFYRSTTVLAANTPDDTLGLVFEQQLKATDITAGYVDLTDIVPGPSALSSTDLRGPTIYTAPNRDGINASNRNPPGCLEVCEHKDRVWYGNITQPGEFELRILAVGGTSGITSGDILSFSGLTAAFTLTAVPAVDVSLTRTLGTTVTGTSSPAHGLIAGDYVQFVSPGAAFAAGPFLVATVPTIYTFTYAEAGSNVTLAAQLLYKSTVSGLANGKYLLRSEDSGTVSAKISATVQNIASAFNKHTGNSELWAQVLEPSDEPLPYLLFRGRTAATTSFFVSAGAGSRRSCFSPQLAPQNHTVSLQRASNVVTATATANSFAIGETVLIAPGGTAGGATFGVGPFLITGANATTFTYAETGADGGPLAAQDAALYPQDIGEAEEEIKPNRIYYSKVGEHGATTRNGYVDVGDAQTTVKAMLSQRSTIWVWTTKGLFKIVGGADPSVIPTDIAVEDVDSTIRLWATESVVIFANRCWGLTDRGVIAVSESGIEVMSAAIADDLNRAKATADANYQSMVDLGYGSVDFDENAFATAYETEGEYILHIPTVFDEAGNKAWGENDKFDGCSLAYVFSAGSAAWSQWDWGATWETSYALKRCALVNLANNKLYLGEGADLTLGRKGVVFCERKDRQYADYRDSTQHRQKVDLQGSLGAYEVLATPSSGGAPEFVVGDRFFLPVGNADFPPGSYVVTVVTSTTFTYLNSREGFPGNPTLASQLVVHEKPIPITWEWVLQTMGAPHKEKRWDELEFIFGRREYGFPTAPINSQRVFDLALANETASVAAFEVASEETQTARVWVNAEVARGSRLLVTLTHDTWDEPFDLAGLALKAEVLDGASTR